jgi:hypothetical protein
VSDVILEIESLSAGYGDVRVPFGRHGLVIETGRVATRGTTE